MWETNRVRFRQIEIKKKSERIGCDRKKWEVETINMWGSIYNPGNMLQYYSMKEQNADMWKQKGHIYIER